MRLALPSVMTAIPSASLVVRTSAFIVCSFPSNVISKLTFAATTLLVTSRFRDHLGKLSLAQPGLERALRVLQQLDHCLLVGAAGSARLLFWIPVNRKDWGRLDCLVDFQEADLVRWSRQRREAIAAARRHHQARFHELGQHTADARLMRADACGQVRRGHLFTVMVAKRRHDVDTERKLVVDPRHIMVITKVTFYARSFRSRAPKIVLSGSAGPPPPTRRTPPCRTRSRRDPSPLRTLRSGGPRCADSANDRHRSR